MRALILLALLLSACDHTRNPLMFPAGPSKRDTCPEGTKWSAVDGKCEAKTAEGECLTIGADLSHCDWQQVDAGLWECRRPSVPIVAPCDAGLNLGATK